MALKVKNGQTLLFIGDSITDCGRRMAERPLGNGYVKLVADLCVIREPNKRIRILNKGIGGDRVTGLRQRWSDDVLRNEPDWLSIKIGINDLHSHLRGGYADVVPPDLFEECYEEILRRTKESLPRCKILLVSPFFISTERAAGTWRREVLDLLPAYLNVVKRMSRRHRTAFLDTHALFQKLLGHREADTFCPEPVHPNATGHLALAEAVYAALSR